MNIKNRLYISAGISIVLAAILFSAVLISSNRITEENTKRDLLRNVQAAVMELDMVAYEYLLHHERRMEQQWKLKYLSMAEILQDETMETMRAPYAALGNLFSQLIASHEKREKLIQEKASREKIDTAFPLEERLVSQLLIKSHLLYTGVSRLAEEAQTRVTRTRSLLGNLTLFLVGILAITVAAASLMVAQSISKPLDELTKGAEIIGKGDLEHKVKVASKDELGELGRAFNQMTTKLKTTTISREWFSTTLMSIGDAVISTDIKSHVTFMNPIAEDLTGWKQTEAAGRPLPEVFNAINENTREKCENIVARAIKTGKIIGLANHTVLVARDKTERAIDDSAAPIRDQKNNIIGVVLVFRDVAERRKIEKEKNRILSALKERTKELECLYNIADIVETPNISLEEIFQKTVKIMPPAWRYPEITCARIIFEDQEFKTDNFKAAKWKQAAEIKLYGKKAGLMEVYYLKEKPELDEGPFLKEERELINVIAERLGRIAERKQAEEELRLSDEILKNASEGIYLIGMNDGLIKRTNPKFEEMFGYGPGEMIGKSVSIVNAPIDKTADATKNEIMQTIKKTGGWKGEIKNIKKDGTLFWSYANVSLFDYSEYGQIIVSIHTDITERKRAEEVLRIKDKAISSTINAIAIADLNGNLTYINHSFLRMWGHTHEKEVLGRSAVEFWEAGENAAEVIEALAKKGSWQGELLARKKDKEVFNVQLSASMVMGETGKPICMMASFIDITERKRAEGELKNKMNDLEIFHKAAVGRELKMVELKNKIKELEKKND